MYKNLLKPLSLLLVSLFLVTACGDNTKNPDQQGGPQSPKDGDNGDADNDDKDNDDKDNDDKDNDDKDNDDEDNDDDEPPALDKIQQLHTALQDPALKGKLEELWKEVADTWQQQRVTGSMITYYGPFHTNKISENQAVLDVFTQLSPAIDELASKPASDFDTEEKATQALDALTKRLRIPNPSGGDDIPLTLPTIKKAAKQLQKLAHVDTTNTTTVLQNPYVFVCQEDVQKHVSDAGSYAGDGNGAGKGLNIKGHNQITFAEAQLLCKLAQILIALAS